MSGRKHGKRKSATPTKIALSFNRPRKDNPPPIPDANQTPQENQTASGQIPLPSQVDPTPRLADKTEDKWYQSLQGWKSILEVLAIPFAIGYAVVTYFQWGDLRKNFIVDERPWVEMQNVNTPLEVKVGEVFSAYTDIHNFGKTPANRVHVLMSIRILRGTFPTNPPYDPSAHPTFGNDPQKRSTSSLMPGEQTKSGWVSLNHPITAEEMKSLSSGESGLYFYGRVEYCDIFDTLHHRHFCSQWFPGSKNAFASCGSYNDGDEDYPNTKHLVCSEEQ